MQNPARVRQMRYAFLAPFHARRLREARCCLVPTTRLPWPLVYGVFNGVFQMKTSS